MNTTTQEAHLIQMECTVCRQVDNLVHALDLSPMLNDMDITLTCDCTKGFREYLVWMPNEQPNKTKVMFFDEERQIINMYSPYQSGDTIPTKDGPRIAGEVRLKKVGDMFSDNSFQTVGDVFAFGSFAYDRYLCIAKSKPI